MLSVRNSGGGSGGEHEGLTLRIGGKPYDTGTTSGVAMNRQQIYGYYRISSVQKTFTIYYGYTQIDVEPTTQP